MLAWSALAGRSSCSTSERASASLEALALRMSTELVRGSAITTTRWLGSELAPGPPPPPRLFSSISLDTATAMSLAMEFLMTTTCTSAAGRGLSSVAMTLDSRFRLAA